jgi:hypothetical protein
MLHIVLGPSEGAVFNQKLEFEIIYTSSADETCMRAVRVCASFRTQQLHQAHDTVLAPGAAMPCHTPAFSTVQYSTLCEHRQNTGLFKLLHVLQLPSIMIICR